MAESGRPGEVTPPPVLAPPIQGPSIKPPPIASPPAKRSAAPVILIIAVVLAVGFFVVVIGAAILVPGLLRARMTANETSAITSLKAIATAQVTYAATCGRGSFAASLPVLGRPVTDGEPGLLGQTLTGTGAPQAHGYSITMAAGARAVAGPADCHGTPTVTNFYAAAQPVAFGTTGTRSFAIDMENTVWMLTGPAAPLEPFASPATVVR